MGIHSLWEALESVAERVSLQKLAVEHRIKAIKESRPDDTLTLGVDMGTFSTECEGGERASGLHSAHAGGGLYIFFRRLAEFLHIPLALVFVFDGHDRPDEKRGHTVIDKAKWWEGLSQELLGHHGYRKHQAPGEAEAELAMLNRDGLVHGVITSDSDVLVFGAKMVLRIIPQGRRRFPDEFILYRSETIAKELNLSHEALIMAAISQGGDYDAGIRGCGSKTAIALGRCGFGDTLIPAFKELRGKEFRDFVTAWRVNVRKELTDNSCGLMSARQPAVANAMPQDFPDLDILNLYVNPVTGFNLNHAVPPPFGLPREPNISQITKFAEQHFYLGGKVLLKRFSDLFFEGVCLQAIYSPLAIYNSSTQQVITPLTRLPVQQISQETRGQGTAMGDADGPQVKLVVSPVDLISSMGGDYKNFAQGNITVWPPTALLPAELAAGLIGSGQGHLKAMVAPDDGVLNGLDQIVDLDSDDDEAYEYDLHDFLPAPPVVIPARRRNHSLGFLDLTDPGAQFIKYKVDEAGAIDLTDEVNVNSHDVDENQVNEEGIIDLTSDD